MVIFHSYVNVYQRISVVSWFPFHPKAPLFQQKGDFWGVEVAPVLRIKKRSKRGLGEPETPGAWTRLGALDSSVFDGFVAGTLFVKIRIHGETLCMSSCLQEKSHYINIIYHIWRFPNILGSPEIIHFERIFHGIFHEINHPASLG